MIRAHLAPLHIPPFGRLLLSYTLNSVGDYVGLVALAVLVYAKTHDPLATTALFIAAQFLPAFVAPVLTAHVDQRALRRVLPLIYLGEAVLFLGLSLIAAHGFWLPAVLVLALLDGVLMLTARGLTRGAVNAVLAPAGELRGGNGLMNVGFALSGVGGSALGGVLVSAFGASAALAVDAASFAVIALLMATTRHLPAAHATPQPFVDRVRQGVAHVRGNRVVRLLIGGEALALVLFTLIVPIEIVYAEETLKTGEAGYGILLASWSAGVVLGSVVFVGAKRFSAMTLIVCSTLAIGIAYLGMAGSRALAPACAFAVLGGVGNGIQWVSVMTALQEATPADLQARVTGLLESVASVGTGIGFFVGGLITALATPPAAFASAGGALILLVGAGVLLRTFMPSGRSAARPRSSRAQAERR